MRLGVAGVGQFGLDVGRGRLLAHSASEHVFHADIFGRLGYHFGGGLGAGGSGGFGLLRGLDFGDLLVGGKLLAFNH